MIPVALVLLAVTALMMGWLAVRHVHVDKHDTQIRALKAKVQQEIVRTCAAAKKGDSCAALRLEALKDTLSEQSVRLTGAVRPPSTVILPPDAPGNPAS